MSVTDILSIQLYTLRAMDNLDRILDTVADAGYRNVEMVGSHLDDAATIKSKLDARGLKASSSHVSLAALREKPEAVLGACETLGFKDLFMPAVPPEQRDMDATGWRSLGKELGKIAEHFQGRGVRLGYHNHHWELKPKDGEKTALELIFEAAGGSPLTWQVDVAWLVRGGADPEHWIDRYRDRITAAHVKDIAPTGQNEDQDGWADVGSGVLDWRDLWKVCREAGAEWMVVEHDKPADPARTARNSFAFLRGIED
ncbi:sugar phosphate isomerase/epimerase family protein [Microvirga rosea]|uniref:sugar phosphate isomerase/epimerase family protein n=1 Tax=Microvirga rosea TaxID=2715425 RepID=UPI001D09D9B5|nr:sugar phosphate isomerase/epimerase [Microvirga rosea]MCB8821809.1 sugar phosphate isomerase/epimerase [Microvirga rosea]